jgi:hypothetical protein
LEGIRVVENTGHRAAVEIYTRNPIKIKKINHKINTISKHR